MHHPIRDAEKLQVEKMNQIHVITQDEVEFEENNNLHDNETPHDANQNKSTFRHKSYVQTTLFKDHIRQAKAKLTSVAEYTKHDGTRVRGYTKLSPIKTAASVQKIGKSSKETKLQEINKLDPETKKLIGKLRFERTMELSKLIRQPFKN